MNQIKEQLELKYGPLEEVRINDRFATFSAVGGNERVFIKIAVKSELRERLRTEAAGLIAMRELDLGQRLYKVPRIIDLTETYIITEWANGKPMQSNSHHKYLQKLFAMIDSRSSGEIGITRYNQPGERSGVDVFLERMSSVGYSDHFDTNLIGKTANFIRDTLPVTETRFTNGDLQPGNLLVDDDSIWLVDCETTSWLWPRHYNIVNYVFNTAARDKGAIPILRELFDSYCDDIGIRSAENIAAFNVSAAIRCFGLIIENLSVHKNTPIPVFDPSIRIYVQESLERINSGKLFFH